VVTALAPDPAGRRVAVGGRRGEVAVGSGADTPTWARAVGSGPIGSVEFAPDGRRLLVASHDGFTVVLDAADGREVLRVESNAGPVYAARWSPTGAGW
jgi:WD40 repeat protein